jgi:hypothetical protein
MLDKLGYRHIHYLLLSRSNSGYTSAPQFVFLTSLPACSLAICAFLLEQPSQTGKVSLHIERGNIPFVKYAKYLGVLFYRKITWNPHTNSRNQGLEIIY